MGIRRDIGTYAGSSAKGNTDSYDNNLDLDVLIVGAGFGGIYLLHHLRDKQGKKCKIFEAGGDIGGIWYWNSYPGARVDSPIPVYEYSLPEVWKDWNWTEKYPSWKELRQYFDHVDKKLEARKDTALNTKVVGADYDQKAQKWTVTTEDGRTARCTHLINAVGFAAKRYFPDYPGIDKFKGEMYHSSFWPEYKDVQYSNKKVAVIGTGATGIQLAQDMMRDDAKVTVFVRTPNLCLPMAQQKLTKEVQEAKKKDYPEIFRHRLTTFGGFPFDFREKNTLDDTDEARELFYEELWEQGGFNYWLATYQDTLFSKEANQKAYDFWAKKTRARLPDPHKRDTLAPLEKPHFFGTKRPSLEQDYYEQISKPHNSVVNLKKTPIEEFNEKGIKTQDGTQHDFDIIALATGFDSVTGGMKNMGLRDTDGKDLGEKWQGTTSSHLGLACAGYPNMFFLYGAQGPTAFSNGPSCVEVQADWIIDAIAKMDKDGIAVVEAKPEAEDEWRRKVNELGDKTLFPLTDSWYMGSNVPGKTREMLNYPGGIPTYNKEIRQSLDNGFEGFKVTKK